jgi:hypothetical protein
MATRMFLIMSYLLLFPPYNLRRSYERKKRVQLGRIRVRLFFEVCPSLSGCIVEEPFRK